MRPVLPLAAIALAAVTVTPAIAAPKPPVVLVHGAWESASIWGQVEQKLRKDGYAVQVVTLPGRPGNPEPAPNVTFDQYTKTIVSALAKAPRPAVLVGHSFGGFSISAAGEAAPQKIKTLVYVAAYLPLDGQSLLGLATTDAGSKAGPALVIEKEKGYASVKYEARAGLFANDAPAEVGDVVAKSIIDEPLAPLATPIHLTPDRFGKLDKVYVHTARDQVVSPDFQQKMVAATPVRLELTVDTGHTPFVTNPVALVAAVEKAAE
jgi:pimeloyl-ACP methyl ester carboxylesterase